MKIAALLVATSTAITPLEARLTRALERCSDAVDVCHAELDVERTRPPEVEVIERVPGWVWIVIGVGAAGAFVGGVAVGAEVRR